MASLRQKSNGRFYIDYRESDGERKRLELFTGRGAGKQAVESREVAEALYAAFMAERRRVAHVGEVDKAAGAKVRDLCDFYVREYLRGTNAAPRTVGAAECHLDAFRMYLAEKKLGRAHQVTSRVMLGFGAWLREHKKIHERTVGYYIGSVRTMLNVAYRAELIPAVPVREWVIPRAPEPEVVALSPLELVTTLALVSAHEPGLHDICCWMAWTGQRPSDAVAIVPEQIDLRLGTVERTTTKVKRLRKFSMTPPALGLARRLIEAGAPKGEPLFQYKGRCLTVNIIGHKLSGLNARVEFPRYWSAKTLRSTFGTIMANEPVSMPLPDLQVAMGHTDITTTMKYVKAVNGDVARARFGELM